MSTPLLSGRRETVRINVGRVAVGGGAPIALQTMANTDTRDVEATVEQIKAAAALGCDINRVAVPDEAAADALRDIKRGIGDLPLVADIHFDYRLALKALDAGIDALRINPGNIGGGDRVRAVVNAAKTRKCPIRVGVNGGSLEKDILAKHGSATPEALVESAMRHVRMLEDAGHDAIAVSVKASDVPRTIRAYRLLSQATQWPLHVGVTEAGTMLAGATRSAAALGILLSEGIGDTIRVSLSDTPINEVRVGRELLRSLQLRAPGPSVTSCPTCGRTEVNLIGMAQEVEAAVERLYSEHPELPAMHIAVMGCVVNGPGEARDADFALVGGKNAFFLYSRGRQLAQFPESEALPALLSAILSSSSQQQPQTQRKAK